MIRTLKRSNVVMFFFTGLICFYAEWIRPNLANFITLFRYFAAIYIAHQLRHLYDAFYVMFFWFITASFSDLFDGAIARWYGIQSRIGATLERIADKVLIILVVYNLLYYLFPLPGWKFLYKLFATLMTIIIIFEVVLFAGAIYGKITDKRVEAKIEGKNKMGWECGVLCLLFLILALVEKFGVNVNFHSGLILTVILGSAFYYGFTRACKESSIGKLFEIYGWVGLSLFSAYKLEISLYNYGLGVMTLGAMIAIYYACMSIKGYEQDLFQRS